VNENGLNEMVGKLLEKYLNVFLVELPSLSRAREVDHAIDLISNVKPISRSTIGFLGMFLCYCEKEGWDFKTLCPPFVIIKNNWSGSLSIGSPKVLMNS
jgi:hypothetical protein